MPLTQHSPIGISMTSCSSHSLGPWPKSRDIRLFSYRDKVFKIRLMMSTKHETDSSNNSMNNPAIHSDIDRCIATLLKNPPKRATPQNFKSSDQTSFIVELRSWKPTDSFLEKMKQQSIEIYPYSFKVTGVTEFPLTVAQDNSIISVRKPGTQTFEDSLPSRKRLHGDIAKHSNDQDLIIETPSADITKTSTPKVDLDKRLPNETTLPTSSPETIPVKKPKLDLSKPESISKKVENETVTDDDMQPSETTSINHNEMDTADEIEVLPSQTPASTTHSSVPAET